MVNRRMNKPLGKIGPHTVFWMHQVAQVSWNCRSCGARQPGGLVALECTVKYVHKEDAEIKRVPVQVYLCLECADKLLSEALDHVRVCRNLGAEAYQLMRDM